MNKTEVAMLIKQRIDKLSQKYETKGEQLLYEQGILLGMIASLALRNTKSFDLVLKKLNELESKE